MAEFIDKVSRTVKKTARKVAKKTTELASVVKLNIKIKSKEADLEEKQRELGKVYALYAEKATDELKERVEKARLEVSEIEEKIATLKAKLAKLNGDVLCTSCGEYVSSSKDFCPKCKASLERIVVDTPADETK